MQRCATPPRVDTSSLYTALHNILCIELFVCLRGINIENFLLLHAGPASNNVEPAGPVDLSVAFILRYELTVAADSQSWR